MGVENVSPTAAFALRFALIEMFWVAAGGRSVTGGIVIEDVPEGFTTPLAETQPCTRAPASVTSWPCALRWNVPSRVNSVPLLGSLTMKKPLP